MKRSIFLTVASLLCLASIAQDDDTYSMYVYLSDGSVETYAVNDVDSVVFVSNDDATSSHAYVDLGLSVKWATCNIEAESTSDYGDYYAWGETATKNSYSSANSATYGIELNDIAGDADYDVATALWGGTWRMPTYDECAELVDNCTWEWTAVDDTNGYLVTGPNGNSIFLPAAGYRRGGSLLSTGTTGCYWSSTTSGNGNGLAGCIYFISSTYSMEGFYRYRGHTVRPVTE